MVKVATYTVSGFPVKYNRALLVRIYDSREKCIFAFENVVIICASIVLFLRRLKSLITISLRDGSGGQSV